MKQFCILSVIIALIVPDSAFCKDAQFSRIKASEIGRIFKGNEFGDDTHWAETYKLDGVLEGIGMGRRFVKKWLIKDDTICIISDNGEECREVWKLRGAIELRRYADDPVPKAGTIKKK